MPDIPDTMIAAVIDEFGGPSRLDVRRHRVPTVDDGEILMRVHTAGVGVWDPYEREGRMKDWTDSEPEFPYVLGSDGAGTVAAAGADVDRLQEGDRVYASAFQNPKGGFYAEYAAVPAGLAMPVPDGLDLEAAGAMPVDAVTALCGLRDALEVGEGDTVAVFGASGGVGHLALQLARAMGAKVLAVASGTDGVALADELDAEQSADGHTPDEVSAALARLAPNGLDSALLTASGEGLDRLLDGIRPGGRVAWPNGVWPEPETPRGVEASSYNGRPEPDILADLNGLIESGPFVVHVERTFPLAEVAEAHRALDGHYRGKLAIRVEA